MIVLQPRNKVSGDEVERTLDLRAVVFDTGLMTIKVSVRFVCSLAFQIRSINIDINPSSHHYEAELQRR